MITNGIILAAGRGERMRPLTDHTPKPMLDVHGQPLMAWAAQRMQAGGVQTLIVNTAWLGEHIESHFGDHASGLPIHYSHEGLDFGRALETAGGIARALPLLPAAAPAFWLAAGDVYAPDFDFSTSDTLGRPMAWVDAFLRSPRLAHLWMVANPDHHPHGDFTLTADGLLHHGADATGPRLNYATIGLFKPTLFSQAWSQIPAGNPAGVASPLAPLLRQAMDAGLVSGARYDGQWVDVGTPARLATLNATPPHASHGRTG